jgi:hypothetical protein
MPRISKRSTLIFELVIGRGAIIVKLDMPPHRRVDAIRERVKRALIVFAAIVSFSELFVLFH